MRTVTWEVVGTNDVAVGALGVLLRRLNKETELSVDIRLGAVVVGDVRARDRRRAVALRGHCVLVGHVLRPVSGQNSLDVKNGVVGRVRLAV